MVTFSGKACLLALVVICLEWNLTECRFRLGKSKKFLYLDRNDTDPVVEYVGSSEKDPSRPDFLYSPNTGPRVVEFYAPWCPHCRHFLSHYVDYARKVTQAFEASKVDVASHIKFYAVSCTVHKQICSDFKIMSYPQIKVLKPGRSESTADIYPKMLHPFELATILDIQNLDQINFGELPAKDTRTTKEVSNLIKRKMEYYRRKRATFDDAYRSFDYSMRNFVFRGNGSLDVKPKAYLKAWLELLIKATPSSGKLQRTAKAIRDDFDNAVQDKEHLLAIMDNLSEPPTKWSSSCSKGQSGAGYLCGLWKLLHIVTIGTLEWKKEQGSSDEAIIRADEAGDDLRNFVEHYSGCEECKSFVSAYDQCELDRCKRLSSDRNGGEASLRQLSLWLFEMHNKINLRLMGEKSNKEGRLPNNEDRLDSRWPSASECPKCWRGDSGFDQNVVLKHLRIEYWLEDPTAEQYREELGEQLVIPGDYNSRMLDEGESLSFFPIVGGMSILALICCVFRDHRRNKAGMPHNE